jgi:hypothetical protein
MAWLTHQPHPMLLCMCWFPHLCQPSMLPQPSILLLQTPSTPLNLSSRPHHAAALLSSIPPHLRLT